MPVSDEDVVDSFTNGKRNEESPTRRNEEGGESDGLVPPTLLVEGENNRSTYAHFPKSENAESAESTLAEKNAKETKIAPERSDDVPQQTPQQTAAGTTSSVVLDVASEFRLQYSTRSSNGNANGGNGEIYLGPESARSNAAVNCTPCKWCQKQAIICRTFK